MTRGHVLTAWLLGLALAGGWTVRPPAAVAFIQAWTELHCDPAGIESGFWDDMPGPGPNNEAGLLWLATGVGETRRCHVGAGANFNTTAFPRLTVRAAVNDGAKLVVELRQETEFGCAGTLVAFAAFSSGDNTANSGFITQTVDLPPGFDVSSVCVVLVDLTLGAAQRASALIDHILVSTDYVILPSGVIACVPGTKGGRGPCVGFLETFSQPN